MKKIFVIWSYCNEIGFGVEVDENDYDKAVELAVEGWGMWNNPEEYPEYEQAGYAEPASELLDGAGIGYRILNEEEITDPDDPDSFISGISGVYE